MGLPTERVVAALARHGLKRASQMPIDHALKERLTIVQARIGAAAYKAGRDASSIRLVLASKTQPPEAIRAAYQAGARDFGENYVQEAIAKRAELADLTEIRWHLIGHLQTNKAKTRREHFRSHPDARFGRVSPTRSRERNRRRTCMR